jgi:hypothetical protein
MRIQIEREPRQKVILTETIFNFEDNPETGLPAFIEKGESAELVSIEDKGENTEWYFIENSKGQIFDVNRHQIKLLLLLIVAAFTFSACQTSKAENVRPAVNAIIEGNAQSPNDIDDENTEGYVCLGKTKTGKRCSRRISEETYKAKGAYCWQHKDQDKKNKKPVPCDTDTDCQEKNGK